MSVVWYLIVLLGPALKMALDLYACRLLGTNPAVLTALHRPSLAPGRILPLIGISLRQLLLVWRGGLAGEDSPSHGYNPESIHRFLIARFGSALPPKH